MTILLPGNASLIVPSPFITISRRQPKRWWLSGGVNPTIVVGAWQPKGAASQAESYVNLKNPGTNDMTAPGAAPSWSTSVGWTFVAANSQYLNSGWLPTSGSGIIVRVTNGVAGATSGILVGSENGGQAYFTIFGNNGSNQTAYRYGNSAAQNATGASVNGTAGMSNATRYKDGVSGGGIGGGSISGTTVALAVGARNVVGAISAYWSGDIVAMAIYSSALTAAQMTALHNAIMLL